MTVCLFTDTGASNLTKRKQKLAVQQPLTVDNTLNIQDYRTQRKPISLIPKSLNQERYIELLSDPNKLIVFATGPAGTGKTMLAVLAAIRAFRAGECSRIIITRPAVGVDDEKHGFLPGDLNQKMEP